jgi:hypothetical protein
MRDMLHQPVNGAGIKLADRVTQPESLILAFVAQKPSTSTAGDAVRLPIDGTSMLPTAGPQEIGVPS